MTNWISDLASLPPERRQIKPVGGDRETLVRYALGKFVAGEHVTAQQAADESRSDYTAHGVRLFFGLGVGGEKHGQGLKLDDGTVEFREPSGVDGKKSLKRKRTVYPASRRNCAILLRWLDEHGHGAAAVATDLGYSSEAELQDAVEALR